MHVFIFMPLTVLTIYSYTITVIYFLYYLIWGFEYIRPGYKQEILYF